MRTLFLSITFFFTTFLSIAQNADKSGMSSQVKIENGLLEGTREESGIFAFKGIPYAMPPVGELRWKPPQPVKSWQGIMKAKKFGPMAMQLPIYSDMRFRSDGMNEDCLYLNVWTPGIQDDELYPVMVYFYGGGFRAGDGSEYRYDGENMAKEGIVTLTVNYRLNIFGFFAHPQLSRESPHQASGNYGLHDQAAALEWVHKNISAFGGDPGRVTIAGESAGSSSVSAQMASPLSRDLIAGAIAESGSLLSLNPPVPLAEAEQKGIEFAQKINAADLEQLRAIPADKLLNYLSEPGMPRFKTTVDGYFLPVDPLSIFEAGIQANVPLMVGWNSEERNHRGILGNSEPTPENYKNALKDRFGQEAERILQFYPGSTQEEVLQSATDLAGNLFIGYNTWKLADMHAQTSDQTVYRYYYAHPRPPVKSEDENKPWKRAGGAVHSAEIEYALGNLATNPVFDWQREDYQVSNLMKGYFANFIKTGDPNAKELPRWPAANKGKKVRYLQIAVDPEVKVEINREKFLLLEQLEKQD